MKYLDFIFGKLGSGVFTIFMTITAYFMKYGTITHAELWLRLAEAYITYNAASYLLTDEKSLSLPQVPNPLLNFVHWLANNFFSRKVFVLVIALILAKDGEHGLLTTAEFFELGIFMLGGRMVEKYSRNVQNNMETQQVTASKKVSVKVDDEEGDA
ncbi:hypothetical protein JW960_00660 [candidate division KSB1 bacterium]|nr:hypothetical protein [candidate division KSB1 bacterium]